MAQIKLQTRKATDRIIASHGADQAKRSTVINGIPLSKFVSKSRSLSAMASRWAFPPPSGEASIKNKLLDNFRRTTQKKKEAKQTIADRRATGQQPYMLLPPRLGGLFPPTPTVELKSLATDPSSCVRVFPAYKMYKEGCGLVDMGPTCVEMSVDDHGRDIKHADLVVLASMSDLDNATHVKFLRCAIICVGLGKAVIDVISARKPDGPQRNAGVVQLAAAARQVSATIRIGGDVCKHSSRIVEALELCARAPRSKWHIQKFETAKCPAEQKFQGNRGRKKQTLNVTVDKLEDLQQFLRQARRLKRKHGLNGKFFAKAAQTGQ